MFGLAYGFYQWMFTKRTYNMIIVGLDGAGKTTLLEQSKTMFTDQRGRARSHFSWLSGHFLPICLDFPGRFGLIFGVKRMMPAVPPEKIVPTVGLNIGRLVMGAVELLIWDLGGQATLRAIWPQYYSESHAVIWVLDSTDVDRFEDVSARASPRASTHCPPPP